MAIPTDHDLLQRFTAAHDHAAFHELVRRHLDLVHGIARRSLKNPAEADDVTQAVFLLLSQKARRAQRHTSLAGWLFRATHYCILNAQKAARRRSHHEQKAGGSMQTAPRATPDELLDVLDQALTDLPRTIREAVLLRYLEGRTVDETSTQLGISAAAAGKRATRGLDQLRIHFSRHGYATTPTLLTGLLTAESATAAPLHLANAIAASLSTGTTAAKAALLAKMTAHAMTAASAKITIAAAVVVTLAIAATAATALHRSPPSPKPSAVAISDPLPTALPAPEPPPASAPAPVDETRVAGNVAIAGYNVLLDPVAAENLRHALAPIPGNFSFYTLHQGSAQRVRQSLQTAIHDQHLIAISTFFYNSPITDHVTNLGTDAEFLFVPHLGARLLFNFQHVDTADAKPGDRALQLHLNIDHQEAILTRQEAVTRQEEKLTKTVNVQWNGSIPAGDALVMIGDFGEWQGDHLINATIYEVFKVNAYQTADINYMFDPVTWITQGPTGFRAWADRAWAWGHLNARSAAAQEKTRAKWSRTLSDGTIVTLCGVARPSFWAFCWWDGDGFPTAGQYSTGSGSNFEHGTGPERTLATAVSLRRPGAPPPPDNNDWEYSEDFHGVSTEVPEDAQRVSVYVPVGPWTEHAMKRGDSIDLGDHVLSLTSPNSNGATACFAVLRGDWSPDYEAKVSAILKDEKRLEDRNSHRDFLTLAGDDQDDGEFDAYFETGIKNIDHFIVATRHREVATFEKFATTPTIVPTAPTPDALAAANRLDAQWQDAAAADARETAWEATKDKWAKSAAIPRDETTPDGAMRVMLDKALAGDVPGVRERLTGKDPEAVQLMSEALAAYYHLWSISLQKFGDEPLRRAIARQGIDMSEEDEYLGRNWKIEGDHATDPQGEAFLLRINGKWRLNIDPLLIEMPKTKLAPMVHQLQHDDQQLTADLAAGKIPHLPTLVTRLKQIAATTNSEQ